MTEVTTTADLPSTPSDSGAIVAKSDRRHFLYRCVLLPSIILACGGWFLLDGFIRWPEETEQFGVLTRKIEFAEAVGDKKEAAEAAEARKKVTNHSDFDIRLQKVLGFSLPVFGVAAFLFFYRLQRGEVRLEQDVIYAPGHPPVPLDAIRQIDKSKWDRKGIATLDYELEGPKPRTGRLKLDDALYDQKPIHQILNHIEQTLVPPTEADAPQAS